jgi:LDH2 family malate/lactate/ureidoglycolate dehydrogenase
MSSYIKDLKKQKSRKQEILYPGEKEWKEEKLRTKKGIPFDLELINSFLEIDKKYNLNYFNKLI